MRISRRDALQGAALAAAGLVQPLAEGAHAAPGGDGKVVFGSRDGNFYILDAKGGRELWRYKADGRFLSTPCIVDGHIWIGTATGWFYCFGP